MRKNHLWTVSVPFFEHKFIFMIDKIYKNSIISIVIM